MRTNGWVPWFLFGFACFAYAMYRAWRDEYRARIAAEKCVQELQALCITQGGLGHIYQQVSVEKL
jgi:hypothetical protein